MVPGKQSMAVMLKILFNLRWFINEFCSNVMLSDAVHSGLQSSENTKELSAGLFRPPGAPIVFLESEELVVMETFGPSE